MLASLPGSSHREGQTKRVCMLASLPVSRSQGGADEDGAARRSCGAIQLGPGPKQVD